MTNLLLGLLLAGGLVVIGCGDDDDDGDGGTTTGPTTSTIAEVVTKNATLTTLDSALAAAGLDTVLANEEGPFTVFAPTDDAFGALPAGLLDTLLADPRGDLRTILRYHIVRAELPADTLTALTSVTTTQGDEIQISTSNGDVLLNGNARVVVTNIEASNGIVHVIDAVLTPPTAAE